MGDKFGITSTVKNSGVEVFSTTMGEGGRATASKSILHDTESTTYNESVRFRPPHENMEIFWGYGFRFLLSEGVATFVFCALCFLVQANLNLTYSKFGLPVATSVLIPINSSYSVLFDTAVSITFNSNMFFASVIRGLVVFILIYQFWNWGKILFNPALTFSYWFLGHITFTRMCFAWVAQFLGSLLGYAVVYTFTCTGSTASSCIDPTVGVGLYNTAAHTPGFHAAWEILGSFILTWTAIWMYSSDKLYKEGITFIASQHKKHSEPSVSHDISIKYGDATLTNGLSWMRTNAIPAEYQQRNTPVYSFNIAVVLGSAYTVLTYIGYLVTGGDGSLNFLLWFPRVLNQSGKNGELGISLAEQGSIYFFCPFVGAILAVVSMFLFIVITRRCTYDKDSSITDPVIMEDESGFTY
jgi:glycerol uptake facilitator-like aquaporin